jgi:CheY-like chemotaxis protein
MDEDRRRRAADPGKAMDEAVWREAISLERVLVVSPEMRIRAAVSEALEEIGYRIRAAASAEGAWRVVRAEIPDAAIVDLTTDSPAVADAAERIRAAAFPRRIPTLALTSEAVTEGALHARGIDRGVVVPLRVCELVAALQELVEESRTIAGSRPRLWAQAAMELQDRMEARHLTLGTICHLRFVFDVAPGNDPYVAELRAKLDRMSIPSELQVRDGELIVACYPTIAEAFVLGINRFAREELSSALLDAYPELGRDLGALRHRVRELEDEYMRVERRAG